MIFVSGTTARGDDLNGDASVQACAIIQLIQEALSAAGASLDDVVRTVTYVTDMMYEPAIAKVHKNAFEKIRPASTIVEVQCLSPSAALVEIQVDAVLSQSN